MSATREAQQIDLEGGDTCDSVLIDLKFIHITDWSCAYTPEREHELDKSYEESDCERLGTYLLLIVCAWHSGGRCATERDSCV